MWYATVTRVLEYRRYLFVVIIVLGVFFALFGERLLRPLSPTCAAAPDYGQDVPDEIRSQLDALFQQEQLYCITPPAGLKNLVGPVYWGSDGVNSALYFGLSDPVGTVVTRYAFGQDYLPGPRGGPPPVGFRNEIPGRLVYANQAPEGAGFYYLLTGSPGDADYAVDVTIQGPAIPNEGLTGRNVWRDLESLQRFVQGQPAAQRQLTSARAAAPVLPDRWYKQRRRTVAPEFATTVGDPEADPVIIPDPEKLRGAQLAGPQVYQVLNGPLGSGVWVAGVMTGTVPAMVLVPRDGGQAIAADFDTQTYGAQGTPVRLASFSFPPLPPGAVFDGQYWHNGAKRAAAEPDLVVPVVAP